ncbi:hypothetical protein SERLA73DRAFT_86971 [Serpula lacrymans var. lacrymans S7.3]|uniref:C3H1-type domain-containing protein n=2 Tax=Serpula lacrymans var. lacrymans TaxID=341189 RepID=F8PSB1_SERL3|nr:uncharacterized protein SERLADRAFT_414377 [Serpula lacrymans var. lacrymans S7.9]EGO00724.1 hypothetical protein SERLA73DRAFT_86971 [Serpula lacrymans var. lacrymans S7.3]EGO26269.1 hypothetical protein SERLADRAFT_414377 [Serpula lacrymans var. lacrymans S7.9]
MPFGLTIGTDRAVSLQTSIQDELTARGYSPDADPVMAEYITIMIINNKTAAQITSELEDLIGTDFDPSFTDWLFIEAAKGAPESESPSQAPAVPSEPPPEPKTTRDVPPHIPTDPARRPPNTQRVGAPLYQQAISQALPSTSPSAQKRTASARSPSPSGQGPAKSRRTDLPTGPRAMFRDNNANTTNSRSLLERVGGPAGPVRNGNSQGFPRDDIQARIDNITSNSPDPSMMMAGFPNGMPGMDMSAMTGITNPLVLQEMMMNQMALMAQMASSMGMLNPSTGQFMNNGFPMQGVMPDMGMFNDNVGGAGGFPPMNNGRGRGSGRGGRGVGRGRGGQPSSPAAQPNASGFDAVLPVQAETSVPLVSEFSKAIPIATPVPTLASTLNPAPVAAGATAPSPSQRIAYALPERPQSPTLCKFATKCTNSQCRYSHPSPVATAESGVVLSNEACEKGRECKDKDCIKSHTSPAINSPGAEHQKPPTVVSPPTPAAQPYSHPTIPCRFGVACSRPNCPYTHPPRPSSNNHFAQQCRFGAGCTRATCPFQHPEGRVLPSTFHRGLSTTAPMISIQAPETGTMGGPSPHRSVTFNTNKAGENMKDKLERQIKEIEEKKKAVAEAEAAANKKDESKAFPIAV